MCEHANAKRFSCVYPALSAGGEVGRQTSSAPPPGAFRAAVIHFRTGKLSGGTGEIVISIRGRWSRGRSPARGRVLVEFLVELKRRDQHPLGNRFLRRRRGWHACTWRSGP